MTKPSGPGSTAPGAKTPDRAPNSLPAAPHWRQDFSVDWTRTSYVTRREFTRFLTLGSVFLAAGNLFLAVRGSSLRPKGSLERVQIEGAESLAAGSSLAFEYPKGAHALLVRHEDGALSAFSQRCPHLGCAVFQSSDDKTRLECPCHEGYFDARSGGVLAGPPQRGLAPIRLEQDGRRVFAVGGGES